LVVDAGRSKIQGRMQRLQSFDVYGFTIEIHAGVRRFWSPSFKKLMKQKLENGEPFTCSCALFIEKSQNVSVFFARI
jgi:hypothetical protein